MQTIRIGSLDVFSGASREREFRLRHEVYCEEYKYLPSREDGMETDQFDANSFGITLVDVQSGATAGCLRLVPAGQAPLPVELTYQPDSAPEEFRKDMFWGEISRVTVARQFRWGGASADAEYPVVLVGVLAAYALCQAVNIRRVYSLSEPPMARLMRRIGIAMEQVGAVVEHHGLRAPFRIDTGSGLDLLPAERRSDCVRLLEWARSTEGHLQQAA